MKQNSVNAAVMTAPGKFEVRRYPYPEVDDVSMVIELEMCGICGTDKHTFRGETLQYAATPHERQIEYPLICGHENVGRVAATGEGGAGRWGGSQVRSENLGGTAVVSHVATGDQQGGGGQRGGRPGQQD